MVARIHNDPMTHKSGKPRLGPLSIDQLRKMLESARPKHKAKIERGIKQLESK